MYRSAISFASSLVFAAALLASPSSTPGDAGIGYSKGFSVERRNGYEILRVLAPWPGSKRGFSYILYPRGDIRPKGVAADGYFQTPLRRVVVLSTTYLPLIVELGEAGSVVGVDAAAAVSSSAIRGRLASGAAVEVARNGGLDVERVIALRPDAIFAYGMGNEWDVHPKLAEAGLSVAIGGEWNENEPLARAEWIKFIAAFYGKEAEASARFERSAREYERVRALAEGARERPRVLVNGPFQGSWTVSGGRSYMARFIADAGGAYLWADDPSSGGIVLSLEAVFRRALGAEYWLNPSLSVESRADVAALDPRLSSLPAVVAGRVWNNTLRRSPGGGSDYFESSILDPDKVLVDLVKIFHPGLLADRGFTYYKNVGK